MQNIGTLKIQDKLHKSDGAIGRLKYFINSIIIGLYAFLIALGIYLFFTFIIIPVFASQVTNINTLSNLAMNAVYLSAIYPITLSIFNLKKRIADIKGNNENIIAWTIFVFILYCIPGVGLIVSLILLFKKGKIV